MITDFNCCRDWSRIKHNLTLNVKCEVFAFYFYASQKKNNLIKVQLLFFVQLFPPSLILKL